MQFVGFETQKKKVTVSDEFAVDIHFEMEAANFMDEIVVSANRNATSRRQEKAKKDYAKKNARSFADYVLMFMPRDMPFLKIMQLTWNKFQHDKNTLEITKAAQNMIDRVGAFYDSYSDLGKKLKAASPNILARNKHSSFIFYNFAF